MRLVDRFAKWLALTGYRNRLGPLLVQRYGRERYYTPPQVLTTIKVSGMSERFAPYACAMFCSQAAYSEFAAKQRPNAASPVDPLKDSSAPLWAYVAVQDWPTHAHALSDLGHAIQSHLSDFGSGPFGDHGDIGHHGDIGGGGHHGGGAHDGGGGGHDSGGSHGGGSHDGGGGH